MAKPNAIDARPAIAAIQNGAELRRWYWRKDELVAHARALGLKTTAGKFALLDRIAHFLDTGEAQRPADQKPKATSRFDWHKEPLSRDTVITDSYRNTQNVRRFFKAAVGEDFKFTIALMAWMKAHVGHNLGDACAAYHALRAEEAAPGFQTQIKEHNQFNQFTRDFLADNPERGLDDVRRIWALKIQKPSETGRHVYDRADLDLE